MTFQIPQCDCPLPTPVGQTLASNCGGAAIWVFMTILETYLRSQCDLDDPCGRPTPRFRSKPDYDYDFIVIGGGTAGAVAASRLSEVPNWRVLLIEAGEDEPVGSQVPSMLTFFGSHIDWQYKTEKEGNACLNNGGVCYWPRGKVLGGTSVLNGMMYIRGNPQDYDNWEALGNPGWSYKDVLPIFKYSENNLQFNTVDKQFHGEGGLLQVSQFPYHPPMAEEILKGGIELGYYPGDLNGQNSTGFMIAQTLSKNGVRHSSSRAFLRPARDRQNLHILVNTTAARVLIDPESKNVYGVEVIDNKTGQKREIYVKKEVIVSGGAVNSPQILLLSGVGPQEDLKNVGVEPTLNLPGVGKNLVNHVSYQINYFINATDETDLNWETAMHYLLYRNGLMSGTGLSQVTAKIASPFAEPPGVPDTQLYFGGYLATCCIDGAVGALKSENQRSVSISPTVLHPKSKGYLTLASNNPLEHPRIVPNYLSDKHDLGVLLNGIRFANRLSQTTPLRRLGMKLDQTPVKGCEKHVFDSDAYWECAVRRDTAPENHQAGSCKMGPRNDPMAVVDHQLRVHGIRGLRVMDTSIMPKLTSGNTMTPAIMIAEKGTDMIKKAWNNQYKQRVNGRQYYGPKNSPYQDYDYKQYGPQHYGPQHYGRQHNGPQHYGPQHYRNEDYGDKDYWSGEYGDDEPEWY